MMSKADALSFARTSANIAVDCAADYDGLDNSIASHRENIRDTLNDEGASEHEAECFAIYDARILELRPAPVAAAVPAAARVTAADLAVERGIVSRIQAGALAELANLVDPAVDLPLYHDPEFLRAEILRITAGVRADIAAAKAEHLAARRAA
jgi:hypothetical protein